LAENIKYRDMGGRGYKIAQKPSYDIWTFPNTNKIQRKIKTSVQ